MFTYIQDLIDNNNRSRIPLKKILGVVVHETATPNATDTNEKKYFSTPNRKASAHAFVDWDSVTQIIPYNEISWHAGKTANSMFLGIELCHATTQEQFNSVWENATMLFADLFVDNAGIYQVTPYNLMSHEEVSAKWHETDHSDPVGYFAEYGKTVDEFRADVQKAINKKCNFLIERSVEMAKIKFVGVGKDIKIFIDENEVDSNGIIESNGATICINTAKLLRDLGHTVEWAEK